MMESIVLMEQNAISLRIVPEFPGETNPAVPAMEVLMAEIAALGARLSAAGITWFRRGAARNAIKAMNNGRKSRASTSRHGTRAMSRRVF